MIFLFKIAKSRFYWSSVHHGIPTVHWRSFTKLLAMKFNFIKFHWILDHWYCITSIIASEFHRRFNYTSRGASRPNISHKKSYLFMITAISYAEHSHEFTYFLRHTSLPWKMAKRKNTWRLTILGKRPWLLIVIDEKSWDTEEIY